MPKSDLKKLCLNQSGVVHVFVLIVLALGLFAGYYLVNSTILKLKPKASESNTIFLSESPIRITQDFPEGVYVSLCRNIGNDIAGIWQVQSNKSRANFQYNQPEGRCQDPIPDYLTFTQDVPQGAYLKLCVPDQGNTWVWQINESQKIADYKGVEPDSACSNPGQAEAPAVNLGDTSAPSIGRSEPGNNFDGGNMTDPAVDIPNDIPNLEPKVVNVASFTRCGDQGSEITWTWNLLNATDNVAWVYGGTEPIYKGGSNDGKLTVRSLDSGGDYQLALKAVNKNREESAVFEGDGIRQKAAEGCPQPKPIVAPQSRFSLQSTSSCSTGTGYCSVEFLTPYFGANTGNASKICHKESKGSITVVSPTGDVGLFQINVASHGYSIAHWQNVSNNINKAVNMSGGGANWRPWSAAYEYVCGGYTRVPGCGFYPGRPPWQSC